MALFLNQFSYTPEAWAAMLRKPEDRSGVLKALVEKNGGKLLCLYYSFGEHDGFTITEYPDSASAMATVLAVYSAGHLRAVKTTEIFTTAEAVQAMKKGGSVTFQGPKG